ncbi:MAG: hypothetical protein KDA79_06940 [Planctomycetaceae bacterium]|nr:hypothetical protein [Planctomycetaceae bacterium]
MQKSLDRKLAAIHADPHGSREFLLADAKDADMAFGIGAPGLSPERHEGELRLRTLAEYRQNIRDVIRQELVDIVLMSASTSELLTIEEGLFENSPITPAARANDATDIHVVRGGVLHEPPARPFRTASIDQMQCGHSDCAPEERTRGVDLGLYSVTFNNRLADDLPTMEEFHRFREEAERKGFRYFLEIFDPNVPDAIDPELAPKFINDMVARLLAGVPRSGRPQFLKMVYHGPAALEELVNYDPHLVVGILGGSAGTTRDAFQLLYDAKKYGARIALFGRKINSAENQLAFIEFLRLIADGLIEPEEAVRAYHSVLQKLDIQPWRPLEEDLVSQSQVMSYGGSGDAKPKTASKPVAKPEATEKTAAVSPSGPTAPPDLATLSSAERTAWHLERIRRQLGM